MKTKRKPIAPLTKPQSKRMARGSTPPPSPLTLSINGELKRVSFRTQSQDFLSNIQKTFESLEQTGGIRVAAARSRVTARITLCNLTNKHDLCRRLESVRTHLLEVAKGNATEMAGHQTSLEIYPRRSHIEVDISVNGEGPRIEALAKDAGQRLAKTLSRFAKCPAAVRVKSHCVDLEVYQVQCRVLPDSLSTNDGQETAENVVNLANELAVNKLLSKKVTKAVIEGLASTANIGKGAQTHLVNLFLTYAGRFGSLFQWELAESGILVGRMAFPAGLWNLIPTVAPSDRDRALAVAMGSSLLALLDAAAQLKESKKEQTPAFPTALHQIHMFAGQ